MPRYSKNYFRDQGPGSLKSAREVVPMIIDLLHPKRVVDVGCGLGTWLQAFHEQGVTDSWGIDGDYVDRDLLLFPRERFLAFDLRYPVELDDRFDLVVSLEIGEHLPENAAESFVASLTRLGPTVLFSAAIPYQGGRHHVNEQWQGYWCDLFRKRGFVPVDCLRAKLWENPNVVWFYAQNMLLYVEEEHLCHHPGLRQEADRVRPEMISLVHPRAVTQMSFRSALSRLPKLARSSLKRRLKRISRRLQG